MKKHTLSLIYRLLSLSLSHTYSFFTLTHSPSHALDLSRLRHSLWSIAYRFIEKSNITKFDHVRGEKQLHHTKLHLMVNLMVYGDFSINLYAMDGGECLSRDRSSACEGE